MTYYKCGLMIIWFKKDFYYENMEGYTYVYKLLDLDFTKFFNFHSKTENDIFLYLDKYEETN